jgi:hypothetical protein
MTLSSPVATGDLATAAQYNNLRSDVIAGPPSQIARLGADVSMPTTAWYDGPSLSLPAGTWLLIASLTFYGASNPTVTVKLWNGTTVYGSGEGNTGSTGRVTITALGKVTLATTTTVKVSAASSSAATMQAASASNGAGNNASTLVAFIAT